jgi:hypothetical protein
MRESYIVVTKGHAIQASGGKIQRAAKGYLPSVPSNSNNLNSTYTKMETCLRSVTALEGRKSATYV